MQTLMLDGNEIKIFAAFRKRNKVTNLLTYAEPVMFLYGPTHSLAIATTFYFSHIPTRIETGSPPMPILVDAPLPAGYDWASVFWDNNGKSERCAIHILTPPSMTLGDAKKLHKGDMGLLPQERLELNEPPPAQPNGNALVGTVGNQVEVNKANSIAAPQVSTRLSKKRAKAGSAHATVTDLGDKRKIVAAFRRYLKQGYRNHGAAGEVCKLAMWQNQNQNHLHLKESYIDLKVDAVKRYAKVKK